MGGKQADAATPSIETLPKGCSCAQDGSRNVPERWQKTERASRAWREVESRTDEAK